MGFDLSFLIYLYLAGVMCVSLCDQYERLVIRTGTLFLDEEDYNGLLNSYSEDANFQVSFQDDVYENDGDLMHLARADGDELLLRESVINEEVSAATRNLYWYGHFRVPLSHVRILNFGKFRAFTKLIASINDMGRTEAVIEVPANRSIRIFVEVYGYPN